MDVAENLKHSCEMLRGHWTLLDKVVRFMDDPDMVRDFNTYYEVVQHDRFANAALDLASFAIGFCCRVAAERLGREGMPDPVVESLTDAYPYYEQQALVLHL